MIEELMEYETAGDPMTGLKWTRKTTQKVTHELKALGIKEVNRTSVGRLLKDRSWLFIESQSQEEGFRYKKNARSKGAEG